RATGRKSNKLSGPHSHPDAGTAVSKLGTGGGGHGRGAPVLILLAVLAVAGGSIVLAKVCVRVLRTVRRDPRGVAAACRQELAAFLVDQRIEAPRSATLGEIGEIVRSEFGVRPEAFVAAVTAA